MALSALTDNVANSLGMNGPFGGQVTWGSQKMESMTASVHVRSISFLPLFEILLVHFVLNYSGTS